MFAKEIKPMTEDYRNDCAELLINAPYFMNMKAKVRLALKNEILRSAQNLKDMYDESYAENIQTTRDKKEILENLALKTQKLLHSISKLHKSDAELLRTHFTSKTCSFDDISDVLDTLKFAAERAKTEVKRPEYDILFVGHCYHLFSKYSSCKASSTEGGHFCSFVNDMHRLSFGKGAYSMRAIKAVIKRAKSTAAPNSS